MVSMISYLHPKILRKNDPFFSHMTAHTFFGKELTSSLQLWKWFYKVSYENESPRKNIFDFSKFQGVVLWIQFVVLWIL